MDVYVDFAGTGGTFAGCAKTLKKYNPNIRCYLVEPAAAPFLAGMPITNLNHKIQGGGYSMELPLVDKSLIDGFIQVSDEEVM